MSDFFAVHSKRVFVLKKSKSKGLLNKKQARVKSPFNLNTSRDVIPLGFRKFPTPWSPGGFEKYPTKYPVPRGCPIPRPVFPPWGGAHGE